MRWTESLTDTKDINLSKVGDRGFRVAPGVENLPVKAGDPREPQVQSPGRECPLQGEMATHSRILA